MDDFEWERERRCAEYDRARLRAEHEAKAHEICAELDAVCKRHGVRLYGSEDGLELTFDAHLPGCDTFAWVWP
jgi:hypothetical protein